MYVPIGKLFGFTVPVAAVKFIPGALGLPISTDQTPPAVSPVNKLDKDKLLLPLERKQKVVSCGTPEFELGNVFTVIGNVSLQPSGLRATPYTVCVLLNVYNPLVISFAAVGGKAE